MSLEYQLIYLEELVLLAELDSLGPAVVHSEEVGTNTTELEKFVLLHLLGESDHVKVVKSIDGFSQTFIVLLLDQDLPEIQQRVNDDSYSTLDSFIMPEKGY